MALRGADDAHAVRWRDRGLLEGGPVVDLVALSPTRSSSAPTRRATSRCCAVAPQKGRRHVDGRRDTAQACHLGGQAVGERERPA
jgi:hypothetical protein